MHYFLIEGTFPGYGLLYLKENTPGNFCLVPLLIFELLRHKGFFPPLKQKKIKANHTCINDSPKRRHLTNQ